MRSGNIRTLALPELMVLVAAVSCGRGNHLPETQFDRLVAHEDWRAGSVDGPLTLTFMRAAALAPDDRLYVLFPQERLIRAFAADGSVLLSFGGAGDGPGEFRNPATIGLLGDTLWLIDNRDYHISYSVRRVNTSVACYSLSTSAPVLADRRAREVTCRTGAFGVSHSSARPLPIQVRS
jgi:hypothetical protein